MQLQTTFNIDKGIYYFSGQKVEVVNSILDTDLEFMANLIQKGRYSPEGLNQLEKLGNGGFGHVYAYKNFAIKFFTSGIEGTDNHDIKVLKDLQHLDCVPRLYAIVDNRAMIVSRVEGTTIGRYMMDVEDNHIPNYVNPEFNIYYREALCDIVRAGYRPEDLHEYNVMIDSNTGLPVIVDVGLFRPLREPLGSNEVDLDDFSSTRDAIDWVAYPMEKYISALYEDEAKDFLKERMDFMKEYISNIGGNAEIGELMMQKKEQKDEPKSHPEGIVIQPSYFKALEPGKIHIWGAGKGRGKALFNWFKCI